MGLDTETGSHKLRLRIKHVIPFNPCSLAELETPHAQASRAQGSCSAGQARRAGAAPSAQQRQRLCGDPVVQGSGEYPPSPLPQVVSLLVAILWHWGWTLTLHRTFFFLFFSIIF